MSNSDCADGEECSDIDSFDHVGSCYGKSGSTGTASGCAAMPEFNEHCSEAGLGPNAYRCDAGTSPSGSCELHPDQGTYPNGYCCE